MVKLKLKDVFDILLDFIELTIIGMTVFFLVYLFVGQLLEVSGSSMVPTFYDKEQIIAEKLSVHIKPLERGEIVIFRHPEQNNRLLIKRVIGLPNEKIKMLDGSVFINDEKISESYLDIGMLTKGNKSIIDNVEYRIPNNSYVLLGDNREESSDSRVFGAIPQELIVGRAILVYYPLDNIRFIKR